MTKANTSSGITVPLADADGAIRALFEDMKRAWNSGMFSAYADLFTDDADYVTFDGSHLRGRAENQRVHEELARGILRGSKLTGQIESVRLVADDVAVVHAAGNLMLRFHRKPRKSRESRQTMVFVKGDDDHWRISAFQNTRIRPMGALGRFFLRLFSKR